MILGLNQYVLRNYFQIYRIIKFTIMFYFDYLFYRTADYYRINFNDNKGEALGSLLVTLIQGAYLISILLILAFFIPIVNQVFIFHEGKTLLRSNFSLLSFLVFAFNFNRYYTYRNYTLLRQIWAYESNATRLTRGRRFLLTSVLSFVLAIFLSITRKSLLG